MSSEPVSHPYPDRVRPGYPIPDYLTGEIQSKLAYVDERIQRASRQYRAY